MEQSYHLDVLRRELERRCAKNPNYSLRSFAKALGVDAAVISRTLNQVRPLTPVTAKAIAAKLDLSPHETKLFLKSVVVQHAGKTLQDESIEAQIESSRVETELENEKFAVISDWFHYAILELSTTEGFKSNYKYIAKSLKITELDAKLATERMLRLGLLKVVDGKFAPTFQTLSTKDKTKTAPALRRYQKQILSKAIDSLENDDIAVRSMTSMSMAIDPEKLPVARKMIDEFMTQLCDALESGRKKKVYQLGISLYPLQRDQ